MAIFRKIHVSFWSDSFISDLDKDKKLFYLYILTNERTTQCGIYEITKKQISFDLGYTIDTVSKLLEYFIKCNKIRYNEATKELAIKNWIKYNGSTSPKVQSCINKEITNIKDTLLIQYLKSIDTQSQEEEEKEEEEDTDKEEEISEIYNLYPSKCPVKNTSTGKTLKNKDKIRSLLKLKSKDEICSIINRYSKECKESKIYMKNFSTFLNNIPDYSDMNQAQQSAPKKRMVHYKMFGHFYTHYEKAYNENLTSYGAENIEFLNYVEDGN